MKLLAAILCFSHVLAVCLAQAPAGAPAGAPTQEQLEQAVTEGVNKAITLSQQQLTLVEALQAAIAGGNLTAAQAAYEASRPPYEQIEIAAGAFPDIDSDLDARPIDVPGAEANTTPPDEAESGEVFLGWHRIENLLFRDNNISAAEPYAVRLINTTQELISALQNRSNFNAVNLWGGLVDEGTEIGGKKVSSEEETYSDLTILIFYNNFLGVQNFYLPFKPLVQAADPGLSGRVDDAFAAAFTSVAPYAPALQNGQISYQPYSDVTVVQRAPIQRAGYDLASILRQAAGALGVALEAEEEDDECEPKQETAEIAASDPQIQNGLNYFRALLPAQQELAANLTAAIESQNLDAAKAAYLRLRPIYEQIEVLAASFPEIDTDIDAREYAFPLGERDPGFKGGHHIEALLFRDGNVGPEALRFSQGYQESFNQLDAVFNEQGNNSEIFNPNNNFGGILGLANEVVAKKVSSEEEKYSDHSYLIFYNNYKGLYSQAVPFYTTETAALKQQLDQAVRDVAACMPVETQDDILDLEGANSNTDSFVENLSSADYKLYSTATREIKECINRQGYRVRQVLIDTAAALNLIDDCSDFADEVAAARTASGLAPAPAAPVVQAASADGGDD